MRTPSRSVTRWAVGALALFLLVTTGQSAESGSANAHWFKGNLHTHSLWSDGDDYPEMIADWYKRSGYHFLAISDHNVLHHSLSGHG